MSTEAGRRLDRWINEAIVTTPKNRAGYRADVRKAEAEAVAAERARLRAAVEAKLTIDRHEGIIWNDALRAVLAIINEATP